MWCLLECVYVVDLPVSRGDTTDEIGEPAATGIERVPASTGRKGLFCQRPPSVSNLPLPAGQAVADPAMLTIQVTPNLSVNIPNLSPHGACSSGTSILAPSARPSQ